MTQTTTPPNVADVEEAMRDVVDPELGINVVDLGLVYGITVDAQSHAVIDMTLTSAACPLTDVIEDQTAQALEGLVTTHRINWVWMPPWGPDKITEDGRDQLRALGFNLLARSTRARDDARHRGRPRPVRPVDGGLRRATRPLRRRRGDHPRRRRRVRARLRRIHRRGNAVRARAVGRRPRPAWGVCRRAGLRGNVHRLEGRQPPRAVAHGRRRLVPAALRSAPWQPGPRAR